MFDSLRWIFLLAASAIVFSACDAVDSSPGPLPADESRSIAEIQRIPDRLERVSLLSSLLSGLTDEEATGLSEVLDDPLLALPHYERLLIVSAWADHEPAEAADWAFTSANKEIRQEAIGDTVLAWASSDPMAVLERFDVKALAPSLPLMLKSLVEGWYDSGQPGLLDFIQDLGEGDDIQRAVDELLRVRVDRDGGEATVAWARELRSHPKLLKQIHTRLGRYLALVEPRLAVAWCDEFCDKPTAEWAPQMIATSWAVHDGGATMEWLLTRPEGMPTKLAASKGYQTFIKNDWLGAKAWMENTTEAQRQTDTLEGPIGSYLTRRSWVDPADAIGWTKYLKDESQRELARISVARRWLVLDAPAAEAWLATSPLSEEAREKARQLPERFPNRQRIEKARKAPKP